MEIYDERVRDLGKKKADQKFIKDVLLLFRKDIIKPSGGTYRINTYGMFKNYFKVGFRNLVRHRNHSLINISGLAIGFTVAILIGLWVNDELNFNKYHQNYDRIVQVMQHRTIDGEKRTQEAIPMPLGDELRKEYGSDFEQVVMGTRPYERVLSIDDKMLVKKGAFMEPGAASMLSLAMKKGSWDALKNPNSIIISSSTATALFGNEECLNQPIKINNELNLVITGIYEDLPHNTRFNDLSFISTWEIFISSNPRRRAARANPNWANASYLLFAKLRDQSNIDMVSEKIKLVKYNKLPEEYRASNAEVFLHPMKDWRLHSNWVNGIKKGGFSTYVWLFGIIGLFVLILACINFMNLSTAGSERRSKEVGIRKTMGSQKKMLIGQFLTESFMVTILAFVFSFFIVMLVLASFNQLADKQMNIPYNNPVFWLICMGVIVTSSFLSGSYPAFYLSSFQPVMVLKGTFKVSPSSGLFRKALVVAQFTTSIILIIGTLVINNQIQFSKDRSLGYKKDNLLTIAMRTRGFHEQFDFLRNELKNKNAIIEMALSSGPITDVWHNTAGYTWAGKDPDFNPQMAHVRVSPTYGKTVTWEPISGRDFKERSASDSLSVILNETAATYLKFDEPIGTTIRWMDRNYKVIGVVKDMLMESPFDPIKPTMYSTNANERANWITLKLNPNLNTKDALSLIDEVFEAHFPEVLAEYLFIDDLHEEKFSLINRVGKLSEIFALLAIFISCLGLFGLTTFMVERRAKEMSIRKVLGASAFRIWQLVSKEFSLLVGLACLLATPVAWFLLNEWLRGYEYRVELEWITLFISCALAMVIALITVSFRSIKTAGMNPIESLKDE